jgi:hypothetical protein
MVPFSCAFTRKRLVSLSDSAAAMHKMGPIGGSITHGGSKLCLR